MGDASESAASNEEAVSFGLNNNGQRPKVTRELYTDAFMLIVHEPGG